MANSGNHVQPFHSVIHQQPVEEETKDGPYPVVEDSTGPGFMVPQGIASAAFPMNAHSFDINANVFGGLVQGAGNSTIQ